MNTTSLESEYSPSSCIGGNYLPYIEAYRSRSLEALQETNKLGAQWLKVAYGLEPSQSIELCLPPNASRAGLLVFIHGGYWQELSASASLFWATACVTRGYAFAAINYSLAPKVSVAQIVAECQAAITKLFDDASQWGVDATNILVGGSSAGAHLAAMVAMKAYAHPIKRLLLISGIYELAPLIDTSINLALSLDLAQAHALSPQLLDLKNFPASLVCWGEIETMAFKQQSQQFAEKLKANGVACESYEIAHRNHFNVAFDLYEESIGALGAPVLLPSSS